ncbi:related to alpha-1,3-mannosyltransferase [Cephalotrichum gorgonifer]|uniref:Related to alpha-1,3-mannosyltransferase n=1 Tax=Cephalotrichum gorgonifer TaxID=2041049 RepID=A0AAE8MUT7_9PEZI|nr:related to alpha-1,3-mannosyltransferase [Cephalotrichum gorgonifer]
MTWRRRLAYAGASVFVILFLLTGFDLFARDDPALLRAKPLIQDQLANFGIGEKRPEAVYRDTVKDAPKFVAAIMDPEDQRFDRLVCPRPDVSRYEYLIPAKTTTKKTYVFALNLINIAHLLPRLMGSIIEAVRFLGPENCMISIVEGHSKDGTMEILEALRPEAEKLGVEYHFLRSDITPNDGKRVVHLAELRNLALEPLFNNTSAFVKDPTILFLNDVAICMDDILELTHQRVQLGADMTCAMDWSHLKAHPTFYDVWVARSITGNSFFYINATDVNWDHARELFFDDPEGLARFDKNLPVQVFACWNGAVVFGAKPLLEAGIRFRGANVGECRMGEPTYLNKDMWYKGYGKIAVVPTVNLEYDDNHGTWIKEQRGYVTELIKEQNGTDTIDWKGPPEKVLCMPGWKDQTWPAWDDHVDAPPNAD